MKVTAENHIETLLSLMYFYFIANMKTKIIKTN